MDIYHEAWGCVRTPTMSEVARLMTSHGFGMVVRREMDEIRTDRFFSRMFQIDDQGRLTRSQFMEHFIRPVTSFPVLWGEIKGTLPEGRDVGEPGA